MNPEQQEIVDRMKEIATFYDDPKGALELLEKNRNTPITPRFLASEKALYEKRKQNGVGSPLIILELTLDETPIIPESRHSLGLPAYQAEAYYQGK